MEIWDLYDYNGKKLGKTKKRGEKSSENEFHLVINAWIRNSKNEFLIVQRSPNKTFPYMWECVGGSALTGETSLEAAVREIKEEVGLSVDIRTAQFLGRTHRMYDGNPDILEVWIFDGDFSIDEIKCQEEEVCNVKWATSQEIRKMCDNKEFEANAFIDEALYRIR